MREGRKEIYSVTTPRLLKEERNTEFIHIFWKEEGIENKHSGLDVGC